MPARPQLRLLHRQKPAQASRRAPDGSGPREVMVSTVKYLLRTDVHTFAFSVAANSILSFFPFVVLLMTLIRRVFHSRVMYEWWWSCCAITCLPARSSLSAT